MALGSRGFFGWKFRLLESSKELLMGEVTKMIYGDTRRAVHINSRRSTGGEEGKIKLISIITSSQLICRLTDGLYRRSAKNNNDLAAMSYD
jgi:hypothetical protein